MTGLYNVTSGPFGAEPEEESPLPDHAAATIGLLLSIVRKIRAGTCPDDLGDDVVLIGRMMRRK